MTTKTERERALEEFRRCCTHLNQHPEGREIYNLISASLQSPAAERLAEEADELACVVNRMANLHPDGNPKEVIQIAIEALKRYRNFKKR